MATALYVLAVALLLKGRDRAARAAWIAGGACFLAHVAAAFQFEHHWSHSAAYAATADQTAAVFGIHWGGGVYFNYLLAVLWILEAIRWTRSRALHAFFAFMFFNATIVFGSPFARWLGAASLLVIAVVAASRSRRVERAQPRRDR